MSDSCNQSQKSRGFEIILDKKNSVQFTNPSSPTLAIPGGTLKHRGYSLLNMPCNVMDSDDVERGDDHSERPAMPGETATASKVLELHRNPAKYPDLFFQGWSV